MTTIQLSNGDLGGETMLVRCDLTQASAPVQVDYKTGSGWEGTQYQCADARHTSQGLEQIAKQLAARAVEIPEGKFECDSEII